MVNVDRNWSEDREHKSTKYKLDFKWNSISQAPDVGRVEFEGGYIKEFLPSSQWNNFEEACKDVIAQVEYYIECK